MKNVCIHAQSYLTLCKPMDCNLPESFIRGIFQARTLEWLPFPSPGDLPESGIEPESPALDGGFFTTAPPGKPLKHQFSSVQSLSHVRFFATPWTAAHQASLSITNTWSLLKPTSTESVMPSNHLIPCRPLLLPPSIFSSIRVFSNESVLLIRCPKYWSFSFNISPFREYSGLISFRMDWLDLLAVQGTLCLIIIS